MTLKCFLITILQVFLWINVAKCTALSSLSQKMEDGGTINIYGEGSSRRENPSGWKCPTINDIPDISCVCDVPHTVRCRGHVSNSSGLRLLSKELFQFSKTNEYVSLLDLSIHGLKTIPSSTFLGLKLLGLVISNANLKKINNTPFTGLEKDLAALGLPGNKFKNIPASAIKNLISLRWLDFSNNNITRLTTHAFPQLKVLESLNLSGNNLSLIEIEAFGKLPQLKTLNLAWNKLDRVQINERTLWGLNSLRELSLRSNLLNGSLSTTFLSSIPSLVKLDLSHNKIEKIPLNTLSNSKNLLQLDLSYNEIEIIEDHAFEYLWKLQELDLSHNNIVAFSGWSFANLFNLKRLNAADNSLIAVTADLLHQLRNLTYLDLTSNDITILQPNVLNFSRSLNDIDLSENPLHCDCSVIWLMKWLNEAVNISQKSKESFVCTTPPKVENILLVNITEHDLTCANTTTDYYHDAVNEYDEDLHISQAEITLRKAIWIDTGIKMIWNIDQKALPYNCHSLHIYEMKKIDNVINQILSEIMEINCTSVSKRPEEVSVEVPNGLLQLDSTYRFCLVLLRYGDYEDNDRFLSGCSEPINLNSTNRSQELNPTPILTSLTVGVRKSDVVVQTKLDYSNTPCFYQIFVIHDSEVVNKTLLKCSVTTYSFSSLTPQHYTICVKLVDTDTQNITLSQEEIQGGRGFRECTSVLLFSGHDKFTAYFVTVFFTLVGFGFFLTLYIFGRRMWKNGGIPWRFDPRTSKRTKYFLYTGESSSPNISLDPLPSFLLESTTRV